MPLTVEPGFIVCASTSSCVGASTNKNVQPRIILFCIDGATWDIISGLINGETVAHSNLLRSSGFNQPFQIKDWERMLIEPNDSFQNEIFPLESSGVLSQRLTLPAAQNFLVSGEFKCKKSNNITRVRLVKVNGDASTETVLLDEAVQERFAFRVKGFPKKSEAKLEFHITCPVAIDYLRVREDEFLRGIPVGGYEKKALSSKKNKLPNISKLLRTGIHGYLEPLADHSNAIWTSIATGKLPSKHGITGSAKVIDNIPNIWTTADRKCDALWNIIGRFEKMNIGLVRYPITWPAEKVNGFLLPPDTGFWMYTPIKKTPYDSYPENLLNSYSLPLIDVDEYCKEYSRWALGNLDPRSYLGSTFLTISSIYTAFASAKVAIDLFKKERPSVFVPYFNLLDAVSHLTWKYMAPEFYQFVPKGRKNIFENTIENSYIYIDHILGELIKLGGPDVNVIVVSDHGHSRNSSLYASEEDYSGGHDRSLKGIFIFSGKDICRTGLHSTMTSVDLLPNILYLLRYPIADDMDGKVDRRIFRSKRPLSRIKTYDISMRDFKDMPSEMEKKILEYLKSLGYIR